MGTMNNLFYCTCDLFVIVSRSVWMADQVDAASEQTAPNDDEEQHHHDDGSCAHFFSSSMSALSLIHI